MIFSPKQGLRPLSTVWSILCRIGSPLARTRCILSTFSSHCTHSSNEHRWLTSTTSIMFPLKFFGEHWGSNPGLLSEKQVCYLFALLPCPSLSDLFVFVWETPAVKPLRLKSRLEATASNFQLILIGLENLRLKLKRNLQTWARMPFQ